MKITVHRGTHQIGGCVTEYEYDGWHLFVDYGEELPGSPKKGDLQVEGLTYGDISKSALLITHYHGDHIGCITKLPKDLPIYMGKVGRHIQLKLSSHLKYVDGVHQEMIDRLRTVKTFTAGHPIKGIGKFNIMPVTVDHSAFDAYAFKIEANGVSAFHTGDFRTHGFRSGTLPDVIRTYIGKVDYVVCEATNILRPNAANQTEQSLQKEMQELFVKNKYNVVYASSTNLDRLFSLYRAAINSHQFFIIDKYQKRIMDTVSKLDPIWGDAGLYNFEEKRPPIVLTTTRGKFWMTKKLYQLLETKGYVLMARSNSRFDEFIPKLPGPRQVYLSMWEEYVKKTNAAYNKDLAKSVGKEYLPKHTSGHCDMKSLRDFFRLLNPKAIIPIHTENPEKFAELFVEEWKILVLNDGDSVKNTLQNVR